MLSCFRAFPVVAAAILLTGCTNAAQPTDQLPILIDCGAFIPQDQVGKPVTGSNASDVKIGGDPVRSLGLVRIFVTGQPITEDYREDRLNLETDANGNLIKATCG
jgi:hypothetical protein